ncbi:hypothetical protein TELCIR_11568 [Teladorsagia circumcincta]|uniref:Carboxylesterase type B domain-containing protein n=1 Tax=Teladorsagia circumcincta TaxID=45464 RepID=A0A2G9U938_TELCI|nr:hypothetical protein TELCIR_11568 [Teladorsagia circumcincta]
MHGYEIEYVFGVPIYNESAKYTKREQILSEKIIQYWSSFATTGVPRLKDAKSTDIWPEYDGVNNTRSRVAAFVSLPNVADFGSIRTHAIIARLQKIT